MKELVVISGKGGTGKTSIVACFAALHENSILADCDVDAADLHLVTGTRTHHREPFVGEKRASIVADSCTGCGECERMCRFDAIVPDGFSHDPPIFRIDPIACEGCGVCTLVCPADAIEFSDVVNGEWFISETRHGPMVHARLGIAESNSGKLVSLVRNQARGIAVKRGLDLMLIDGPPGIGCPVIASITGSDLILVVTEPTLSGLHDLERVRQLANHFKIRSIACINKFDLNPQMTSQIHEHCKEAGIKVVGQIPYDNIVTHAQIRKQSVVEFSDGSVSQEIRRIYEGILGILEMEVGVRNQRSA